MSVLVEDAMRAFLYAKDLTPATAELYRRVLRGFDTFLHDEHLTTVEALTLTVLRHWMHTLRTQGHFRHPTQPLSSHTLKGRYIVVRSFVQFCVDEGWVAREVVARWEPPKVQHTVIPILSVDQLHWLFDAATNRVAPASTRGCSPAYRHALAQRDAALLAVLVDTGLRVSELCGLTVAEVYLHPQEAWIRVHRKNRKTQDVGLGRRARRLLSQYLAAGRPTLLQALRSGEPRGGEHRQRPPDATAAQVFLTRTGKALTKTQVDDILHSFAAQAGTEHFRGVRVSAHTLRHTFAVRYLEQGGDIYRLRLMLGHESVKSTEVYLRAFSQREVWRDTSVLDALDMPGTSRTQR